MGSWLRHFLCVMSGTYLIFAWISLSISRGNNAPIKLLPRMSHMSVSHLLSPRHKLTCHCRLCQSRSEPLK